MSIKGLERAAALAAYFLGEPIVTKFGHPVAIYAMKPGDGDKSQRSIETVTPLAAALRMAMNMNYTNDQYEQMVDDIKANKDYEGKMVLISWEHDIIPKIAAKFGATTAPKKWEGNIFDRLWLIAFQKEKGVNFENLPQKLMYGDSDK